MKKPHRVSENWPMECAKTADFRGFSHFKQNFAMSNVVFLVSFDAARLGASNEVNGACVFKNSFEHVYEKRAFLRIFRISVMHFLAPTFFFSCTVDEAGYLVRHVSTTF